jgi:hypothetical protein
VATNAFDLALSILRTNAAGDCREGVVVEKAAGSFGEVTLRKEANELRDINHYRATRNALWVFALEAAFCFQQGSFFRQSKIYFLEVGVPDQGFLFRHFLAFNLKPLFGGDFWSHEEGEMFR